MVISDLLSPRKGVRQGEFQGILQTHKVNSDEDRIESDAARLLSMTYPSNAIQTAFDHIGNKIEGADSQGGITLSGPYGAGKSHALLALFHTFNEPQAGQEWLDEWGIDLTIPGNTEATALSTSEVDADRIWEPVFRDLGRDDLVEAVNHYPTTEHIESLTEDGPVAIFFDEIETWWGSLDRENESELVEQNEFFVQHLFEVANDPNEDLFVFVTLLDKNQDLKRILNRTSPYAVDLNDSGDREQIIRHRLFETHPGEVVDKEVRDVVSQYVADYDYPIQIDEPKRYEDRMVETYPFHPSLLDLLDEIYEGGRERQNVRGMMNVLAETIGFRHDETNLIITCDVEPQWFRGINQTLFNRFVSDRDEVTDIEFGEDLLQTILLHTLNERSQEASTTDCLLGTYKPEKSSVDRLDMSLRGLYGRAHYLDRDSEDGPYYITEDPKVTALVTREQERVLDRDDESDEIDTKLAEIVREDVWGGGSSVYVHPDDDVPDNQAITIVVTTEMQSNGSLRSVLDEFFTERKNSNTVLFVTPSDDIAEDDRIREKVARIIGAENLHGKVDEEGELDRIIRDERRELTNELEDRYGQWVKWSERPDKEGELRFRRKSVSADVDDVKTSVGRDKTYVGEAIISELERKSGTLKVGTLLSDFKTFRRLPVLLDDEVFYSAIRQLHRDGSIVLEGDRSNYFVAEKGDYPSEISDDLTIHDPDTLPDYIFEETEDDDESGGGITSYGTDGTSSGGGETTTTTGTEGSSVSVGDVETTSDSGVKTVRENTTTESVSLEGPNSRVLRSQAESRINEGRDTATRVVLTYEMDDLSKSELIELLEGLPAGDHIQAEVTVEREDE